MLSGFPTSAPYNVTPYTVDWVGLGSLPSILDSTIYQTDVDHYDAMGRPGITTLPEDVNSNRKELKAEYNRAGAIKKVYYDGTEYIKEMAFNAKGQPLMTALGNGIMTRYAYSSTNFRLLRSQSEKFTYTNTGNEHKFAYNTGTKKHNTAHQYDLAGNILKILERSTDCGLSGTPDQLDRKFSYDPLNRLLSATGREATTNSDNDLWNDPSQTGSSGNPSPSSMQAYTRTYSYDKMGNVSQLIQTVGNTFTRNFHYDNITTDNLLHSIKKADDTTNYSTFTYDSNGNKLTAGTTRNYVWDYADQLKCYYNQTSTSTPPSTYAQYLYSGGTRVKKLVKTSSGVTVTVYIDGVFEHKYDGTNSQSIVRVGGVATVRTGYAFDELSGTSYELSNHLGSVSIRLDSSGGVIDREEYYPFGDSSVRTWNKKRYRYVGKEKDTESGLYYYGARYYSAWTCRFISVDPLAGKFAMLSSYNYSSNDPIGNFDIDGMQSTNQTSAPPSESSDTSPSNQKTESFTWQFQLNEESGQMEVLTKHEVNAVYDDTGELISGTVSEKKYASVNDFIQSDEYSNLDLETRDFFLTSAENAVTKASNDYESSVNSNSNVFSKENSGNLIIHNLLSARDAHIRLTQYLPKIKENSRIALEVIKEARRINDLNTATLSSLKASMARNEIRVETQEKLSPTGKEVSKAIEQERTYQGTVDKAVAKKGLKPNTFEMAEEVAESAGRSHGERLSGWKRWGSLKNISRAGRILGVVGFIVGVSFSVYNIATAPEGQRGRVIGEEIGGLIFGTIGAILAGAAIAGAIAGAPVLAVLAATAAVGFVVGMIAGWVGRKLGGWFGSMFD